jgi:hypothetical protein
MSEHRETANADVQQTIPRLVGDIASGRAEDFRSCSQKHSRCECFCEQEKRSTTLPQAHRAIHSGNGLI